MADSDGTDGGELFSFPCVSRMQSTVGAEHTPATSSSSRGETKGAEADASSTSPCTQNSTSANDNSAVPSSLGPSAWAAELRDFAIRLLAMAESAPSTGPSKRCAETLTDIEGGEISRWEVTYARLNLVRAQAAAAREKADVENAAADRCAKQFAQVSRSVHFLEEELAAQQFAAETARREANAESQARLVNSEQGVARMRGVVDDVVERASRAEVSWQQTSEQLRTALSSELVRAEDAEAKAAQASQLRNLVSRLPELRQELQVAEGKMRALSSTCAQMQADVQNEKAKLQAATANQAGKTEALETRVARLEQECNDLSSASGPAIGSCSASPAAATDTDAAAHSSRSQLYIEFKAAQESNARLVADVHRVRALRDRAAAEFEAAGEMVDTVRRDFLRADEDRYHLNKQLEDLLHDEGKARNDAQRLRQQIGGFEESIRAEEATAKVARQRQAEVKEVKNSLKEKRRNAMEAAKVLEWRLKKTVDQLEKEKPGTVLAKSFRNSSNSNPPTGFGHQACRGGAGSPPHLPRSKFRGTNVHGGSDGDADSTTAGGESLAEGLP